MLQTAPLSLRIEWDRVGDRDAYPFNLPAIATLAEIDLDAPVAMFVGANGSGKSTFCDVAVPLSVCGRATI